VNTTGNNPREISLPEQTSRRIQLAKIQALTGLLFSIFLALHLSNTILAAVGVEIYTRYQVFLQGFYQHPVIETLLVGIPLVVHATIGTYLLVINRGSKRSFSFKQQLHSWAGIFLLVFLFGHIAATRGIGILIGSSIGFEGISFSLWWMPGYFYPYYLLLFMAGLYHGFNGFFLATKRIGFRIDIKYLSRLRYCVMSLGAIFILIALMAFNGVLFEIEDPVDNDYARFYFDTFGVSLEKPTPDE
jgi:succinate dehydrogenase/fumarate reductase cytochrome b subunit